MPQLHAKMPRDGSSDAQPLAVRHENLGHRKHPFLKPMVWLNESSSKVEASQKRSHYHMAKEANFTVPDIERAMQEAADKCLAKALTNGQTYEKTKTPQPLPTPEDIDSWRKPKARRRHPPGHTQHSHQ